MAQLGEGVAGVELGVHPGQYLAGHEREPVHLTRSQVQFPEREFHMWARVRWAKRAPGQLMGIVAAGMGIKFIEPTAEWLEYFQTHINRK